MIAPVSPHAHVQNYSGILALLRAILPLDVVRSTWEVKAALWYEKPALIFALFPFHNEEYLRRVYV